MFKIVLQKNKRFFFGKKAVAAILAISFIVPPLLILQPKEADAVLFVPVGEIPLAPTHIAHLEETFLNVTGKEYGFDGILWLIAKQLISKITSDLVSWINSGFNGAPAFVTNFQGFMLDVADRTLGAFIEGTSLAFLCDPFKINIKIALQLRFRSIQDRTTCRLSDAVANLQSFMSGNFIEGGFGGLMHMTMIPQNNMYGAYLLAEEALLIRMASNMQKEEKRMDWGRGFLSFETQSCATPEEDDPHCTTETKTPGAVIESQLENVLGSGVRQLELADEFDEIIGALISQLINQVMQQGLSALGSNNTFGPPSYIGQLRTNFAIDNSFPQFATTPTAESVGFVAPPPGTLPPGGPTDPNAFSYTISSPGIVSVAPGGFATVPITKTLQTGAAASVSLVAPASPEIVTSTTFGNDPCVPNCTSNVIFAISPTAATGTHTTFVGGSPESSNGTIPITINVTDASDVIPPTLAVIPVTPITGGGTQTITAIAADNIGINRVEFSSPGLTTVIDAIAPYQMTQFFSEMQQTVTVTAFDDAGLSATEVVTWDNPIGL